MWNWNLWNQSALFLLHSVGTMLFRMQKYWANKIILFCTIPCNLTFPIDTVKCTFTWFQHDFFFFSRWMINFERTFVLQFYVSVENREATFEYSVVSWTTANTLIAGEISPFTMPASRLHHMPAAWENVYIVLICFWFCFCFFHKRKW